MRYSGNFAWQGSNYGYAEWIQLLKINTLLFSLFLTKWKKKDESLPENGGDPVGLETPGDECADNERFVTAVAPVFRLGTGLEEGEALPLARLSPMTRTISLTETPCNSGGRFLNKTK